MPVPWRHADPPRPYRGRFAPSPTGALHGGSLLAALGSWLCARHAGGRWLVRIEDIDPPRAVAGAARQQLETLAAFGLHSDEPVLWQSRRDAHYKAALDQLLAAGLAFECRCSRSDLAPHGGVHRACVPRPSGHRPAIRLRVPAGVVAFEDGLQGPQSQDLRDAVGDFVLRRSEGLWAYQLAVVVDDASQGITEVVRGADLLESTPRQIHLQHALGLPTPSYRHLPLVLDQDGRKLSKSLQAAPVDARDPLPALAWAWRLLGQDADAIPTRGPSERVLQRMLAAFEPAALPARPRLALDAVRQSAGTLGRQDDTHHGSSGRDAT